MIKGENSTVGYGIKLAAIFLAVSAPLSVGAVVGLNSVFHPAPASEVTNNKIPVEGHPIGTEIVDRDRHETWFGLRYSYIVNDKEYTKVNEDDLYLDTPPAWLPEENITIWYNPSNPEDAVFYEGMLPQ